MPALSVDSLRDPHRRDLAGHRASGYARRHCAYLFANRRATRIKVLVHDGFGVWLAVRRLTQGKFHWPTTRHGTQMEFSPEQLQALVIGLPW